MKQEDWTRNKLIKLLDIAKNIHDEEIMNQYAEYTALKLISISYYKTVFLNVVKRNEKAKKYYDGAVYIDLFAGTGLVKLKETGDIIAGSPVCALSANESNFDYAVCVEKDKKKSQVLENRLAKIIPRDQFKVIQGDCNVVIQEVIQAIKSKFDNPIVFTFVDPEGMEIKMETLKLLNDSFKAQDFMINVGAQGVLRVKGKLDKGDMSTESTWNEYWGDENAEALLYEISQGIRVEDKYQEKIAEVLGKKFGETIPIKGIPGNIEYYILAYSRATKGESKYTKALTMLKERIGKEDKKSIRRMLDVISGRNETLF
ncbi:MAG: three-Cys-motif partner protein TcmP [Nitrosopumilus sp.]|nr:three-Cys-motif partner protein TcmP [Nitrosopumilus sp.]